MRAQDQKLSRPPGPTRPDHGRGLGECTLEGFVRRLQLQKIGPARVQNVGNQKRMNPWFYALSWLPRQKLAKPGTKPRFGARWYAEKDRPENEAQLYHDASRRHRCFATRSAGDLW